MTLSKTDIIAAYSFGAAIIRMLSGPLTILIVSAFLTIEEMGFYYTFYSFVTMALLFEVGVGYVLKQFYSHEVKLDASGKLEYESQVRINHIFRFSVHWYSVVVIAYVTGISILGWFYFSDYTGDVEWQAPFFLLVFMTGIRIFVNVFDSYLDGMQHQEVVNAIRLFSTLLAAFTLWLFIYLGFGLLSIALSQLASALAIIVMVIGYRSTVFTYLSNEFSENYSFKEQFRGIFPLFGRTSLVWFFGYFFWNSFTLIAFRIYGAEFAGRIGLSVSMARGGFDIASSFLNNQRTVFANLIANNKVDQSLIIFRKYFIVAIVVLFSGYSAFFVIYQIFPDFYLFNKALDTEQLITLFLFFFITLITSSLNNLVRAYKIEPFVLLSIYSACFVPLAFFIGAKLEFDNIFLLPLSVLIVPVIVSIRTFYLKVYKNV